MTKQIATIALGGVLAAMLVLSPATAVAQIWTGTGYDWNTASNWSPAVVPNSTTADVNFTGNGLSYIVNISSSVSSGSLSFSNSFNYPYSLTSSAGVSLNNVSSITVASGVTAVQTINLSNTATGSLLLKFGGLSITNNSTAAGTTLRIGPNTVISPSTADINFPYLHVDGVGTTEISGSYIEKSSGSASGTVYKLGLGKLVLSNPSNKYYGGTNIYDGTLLLGSGTAIPTNSNVTVIGGGEFNIGSLSNAAATAIAVLFARDGGTFRVPSGSGDYYLKRLGMSGGTVNFAGTSNFWLHVTGFVSDARIYTDQSSTTATWIGSGTSRIQNDTTDPLPITVEAGSTPSGIDLDAGIILSSGVSGVSNPTFIKQGAGTMRLTNPGNTANINVVDGKLRVDDMANLGSGVITLAGGTLQYSGSGASTTKNLTTAGTARIQVSTPGANLNYNGVMTESQFTNLYILGPGTLSAPSTLSLNNNTSNFFNTFVYDNAILAIPTINDAGAPSPIGTDLFSTGIVLGATDSRGTLLLTGTSPAYSTNRKATLSGLYFSGGGGAFGVETATTNLTLSGRMTGSGSLIKTGEGTILLSNPSNNYSGGTYVEAGRLDVSNDAALGSSEVRIYPNGVLRYTASATVGRSIFLDGGVLEAPGDVSLASGGALQGEGTVVGNVANSGSVVPEGSTGLLHVEGNYTQTSSGILIMFADLFLAPGSNSRLDVTGDVALDGTLQMNLGGMGQFRGTRSFDVLDWTGNLTGTFSSLQLPMFGGAFSWDTSQLYNSGVLTLTGPPLEGDFNFDGIVDAADYVVWRKGLGTIYTQTDYDVWRAHFGQIAGGSGATAGLPSSADASSVPEPASVLLLLLGFLIRVSVHGRSSRHNDEPESSTTKEHLPCVA